MDDFALAPAELALLIALRARGVRFLVVGLGAAVLEGAPLATQLLQRHTIDVEATLRARGGSNEQSE